MEQSTEKRKLIDVRNAANRLGCTPQHVYNLIKGGQLKAVRIGDRAGYRIPDDEIARFLESRVVDPERFYQ